MPVPTDDLFFGHDASVGGWGSCLATAEGPLEVTHYQLKGKTWRWDHMRGHLGALDAMLEAPPGMASTTSCATASWLCQMSSGSWVT